jgi:predicted dehydrogenase
MPSQSTSHVSRRSFLKTSTVLAGATIVPRHVLGGSGFVPPSDQLAVAFVGVGCQGLRVMMSMLRNDALRAVAVCDVNSGSGDFVEWGEGELRGKVRDLLQDDTWGPNEGAWAGRDVARSVVEAFYSAKLGAGKYACSAYTDYRRLLEEESGVDAVVVGTPDHQHAPVSVAAMRHGKHVYCQKPMAHTVEEARVMAETARKHGVATQVATGNAASEATRQLTEWIAAGVIGPVREVHNWSSRPFWPQGIDRPLEEQPIPEHLDWDLWLGPARDRPYHAAYQPFVWRGWHDFGTSSIGDMGCYSFDTLYRVLNLGAPSLIEASSTPRFPESYPLATLMHFYFESHGDRPPVTVHWYDGRLKPPVPQELGAKGLPEEGLLFVGDSGKILCAFSGGRPTLIPESRMEDFVSPPETLPRSIGHIEEWIEACKGGPEPAASFSFAQGPTEAILLGNVAVRAGGRIRWNSENRTTGRTDADDLLRQEYRSGWTI